MEHKLNERHTCTQNTHCSASFCEQTTIRFHLLVGDSAVHVCQMFCKSLSSVQDVFSHIKVCLINGGWHLVSSNTHSDRCHLTWGVNLHVTSVTSPQGTTSATLWGTKENGMAPVQGCHTISPNLMFGSGFIGTSLQSSFFIYKYAYFFSLNCLQISYYIVLNSYYSYKLHLWIIPSFTTYLLNSLFGLQNEGKRKILNNIPQSLRS